MSRSLNNTEVPELRFSGFDEDWNELKFNKLIQLISGQHLSPHEYSLDSGEIPYFTGPSDFTNDVSKITKWTKYSEKSAQKSDILITVKGNGVGEMLFLHLPCVAMGRQLMAIRPIAVVGQILYQKLFTYKQQFQALASGNVIPGLSRPDILTTKIYLPGLKEQEKIASFLGAVDTRLTQLRRKHELLQTYKRGVMQKLFSQQIRFKGDDGKPFPDWEKKKLGEVVNFSKGKGISKENLDDTGKLKCIRYAELYTMYGEIINHVFSRTNLDPDDLILSKANDVIIPSSGETAIDIAKAACVCIEGVVLGGDINILRSKIDGRFLAHYLNHYKKHEIASAAQGNTVVHLYNTHLKNIEVEVPDKKEQEKISNFLIAINQKIEAIAQQIDLTKQFKKGLRQKMFV